MRIPAWAVGGTAHARARCAGLKKKKAERVSGQQCERESVYAVRFLAGPSLCLYTNASSLSVLYTGGSMSIGADLSLGSITACSETTE